MGGGLILSTTRAKSLFQLISISWKNVQLQTRLRGGATIKQSEKIVIVFLLHVYFLQNIPTYPGSY